MARKLYVNGKLANFGGIRKGNIKIGGTNYEWSNQYYKVDLYGFSAATNSLLPYPLWTSNMHREDDYDYAIVTFVGYTNFSILINSFGENNYDYINVGQLDKNDLNAIESGASISGTTSGYSGSSIPLSRETWKRVSFPNDGGEHFVIVMYRKDGSVDRSEDRGHFIVDPDSSIGLENKYVIFTKDGDYGFNRWDPDWDDDQDYVDYNITAFMPQFYYSTNWGKDSTRSGVKVTFKGYSSFKLYAGQQSESDYDYIQVTSLNSTSINWSVDGYWDNLSGDYKTDLYPITFSGLNPNQEYYFYIYYKKDGSVSEDKDTGVFAIEGGV